jgi:hypothetical protein
MRHDSLLGFTFRISGLSSLFSLPTSPGRRGGLPAAVSSSLYK